MKIKVIKNFLDKDNENEKILKGSVIEKEEKRANELIENGYAEEVKKEVKTKAKKDEE